MPNRSVYDQVVVCREPVVIQVGGHPAEYAVIEVTDNRTQQKVTIPDTDHEPIVPEDLGVAFAFKTGERVRADHPAVLANPAAFRPIDATDEIIFGLPPTAAADAGASEK